MKLRFGGHILEIVDNHSERLRQAGEKLAKITVRERREIAQILGRKGRQGLGIAIVRISDRPGQVIKEGGDIAVAFIGLVPNIINCPGIEIIGNQRGLARPGRAGYPDY